MTRRKTMLFLHISASILAFLMIASFLAFSFWAEFMAGPTEIAIVKIRIAWCLLLLVPALATAGTTGFAMAGATPKGLARIKAHRMKLIAFNGLFILVPAALFLAWKASGFTFDASFFMVQVLELLAGFANLVLISLNFFDGMKMKRRKRNNDEQPQQAFARL